MAMSKTVRKLVEEEVKLELTPMIDVTFLLLAFFILTMKFRVLEGKLDAQLPTNIGQNAGGAPIDREKVRIRIKVIKSKVKPPELFQMVVKRISFEQFAKEWKQKKGTDFKLQDTEFGMQFMVGNAPVFDMIQKTTFNQGQPTHSYGFYKPNSSTPLGQEGLRVLVAKLNAARGNLEKLPLIIDPDRSSTYAALTMALHAATEAKFTEIQFAGKISPQ